jgi:hypothetical protein
MMRPLTVQRKIALVATITKPRAKSEIDTSCPHCRREIARAIWTRNGARLMAKRRTGGGRAPNLRPCPHCKVQLGIDAMRKHLPACPKRPPVLTPALREAEREARAQ